MYCDKITEFYIWVKPVFCLFLSLIAFIIFIELNGMEHWHFQNPDFFFNEMLVLGDRIYNFVENNGIICYFSGICRHFEYQRLGELIFYESILFNACANDFTLIQFLNIWITRYGLLKIENRKCFEGCIIDDDREWKLTSTK